jgi:hypothetical protein
MVKTSNSKFKDSKTPPDVEIRFEARKPITDSTLGIPVNVTKVGNPQHRLVTIGDSLTHGFQSGAIFNTNQSYPVIIAKEMGWSDMRYPVYSGPEGGLPLNLEYLSRDLRKRFGDKVNWLNGLPAILSIRQYLDAIEEYWERGKGNVYNSQGKINHNLAVYGWDLRNTLSRNADICLDILAQNKPKNDFLRQVVEYHNERSAIVVLNSANTHTSSNGTWARR